MATSFISAADLPLADKDTTVDIDVNGATVTRAIFAGTRVPPELVEAWREQTGAPLTEAEIAARERAQADAEALARVEEQESAAAASGEAPESEQGDPAPARKVSRRAKAGG